MQLFVLADDLAKVGCYPMQLFVLADDLAKVGCYPMQLFVLADDLAKVGCYPMQLFVLADDHTGDCVDVRDVVGFIIGGVSRNDSQVFRFVDRVGLDDLMVVETSVTQTVVVLGFLLDRERSSSVSHRFELFCQVREGETVIGSGADRLSRAVRLTRFFKWSCSTLEVSTVVGRGCDCLIYAQRFGGGIPATIDLGENSHQAHNYKKTGCRI
jgi:hypothetical protein